DPDAILERLLEIRADAGSRRAQADTVARWQAGYGKANTTARMSEQYLALYRDTMLARRQLQHAPRKRTAFVMKGRFPDVPPTAYVRLVDWRQWFEREHGQPVDHVEWSALLRSDIAGYSRI